MDRKLSRRRLIGTGAALAVAAPLAALPFPTGIEPAPVASDTTKTELTDDDRDWAARRETRNEWGNVVTGTEDLTVKRSWFNTPHPLYVIPESDNYHPMFEFLRRSHRQQEGWPAPRSVTSRLEWVWSMPEPLRAGFLALADDIACTAHGRIGTALSDVLYHDLCCNAASEDETDDADWTDADKLDAFSQPTTIGAVLLALSEAMDMAPCEWLNEPDLTLLRQAT